MRWTVSKDIYVRLPWLAECSKNNFELELKRSLSEVKALTLEEWLPATSPRTQNAAFPRFSMLLFILSYNHWPLNVISGIAWTINSADCFNPTTIKATIPLYRLSSSPAQTYSPAWYWAGFGKYISISSTSKMKSVEIWPFSRKTFTLFNESTLPYRILIKSDMEGIGSFSNKSFYIGRDVCLKYSAKRIIEAEEGGLPEWL